MVSQVISSALIVANGSFVSFPCVVSLRGQPTPVCAFFSGKARKRKSGFSSGPEMSAPKFATPTWPPGFNPSEHFEAAAADYEYACGAIMKDFVSHALDLVPPLTADSIVLDNACGPGIVSGEILKLPDASLPDEMYAADISPKMIEMLRAKAERGGAEGERWGRVRAQVMDGTNLSGHPDDFFTHSFTNFGIFLFSDADKGAAEIYRTLRHGGGTAVVTTWAELGYAYLFKEAQQAVRPDLPAFKGPLPAEWLAKAKLKQVMEAGGFQPKDIEITSRTFWLGMREWRDRLELAMRASLTKMITNGWTEADKERFGQELDKVFAESTEMNIKMKMIAWIAVVQK
jgi:ubiquinone/menaquinone biosynthesis C-methylase UbiE